LAAVQRYYNFDGASVRVRPITQLGIEAYGGWSLARGVNEPVTSDEIAAIEPFAPDVGSYIIGAEASYTLRTGTSISAVYQREIRTDRLALYSERMAADGTLRIGRWGFDAAVTYDFATATVNDGRVRFWLPALGPVIASAYARHHRPFFDLWTIWGAFTPLAFDEVGLRAAWQQWDSPFTLEVWGGGRRYSGPEAEQVFGEIRNDGWRAGASASAQLGSDWNVGAQYHADIGFGASISDGNARVQRSFGDGSYMALTASAFQRQYEFRVTEGTTLALGVDGGLLYSARMSVHANVAAYRHTAGTQDADPNWTQVRGSLRFVWTLGTEPLIRSGMGGLR
jgi:hypothetical protein